MTQFACCLQGSDVLAVFLVVIDSSEQMFAASTLDGDGEQHPGAQVAGDLERSMLQPSWILNICTVCAEAQQGEQRKDGSVI